MEDKMKKETKQKRGEILCRITKEESRAFRRIATSKRTLMELLTELSEAQDALWDCLRKKYKLEDEKYMIIDGKGFVIRKVF